jgi:hypothetical protein
MAFELSKTSCPKKDFFSPLVIQISSFLTIANYSGTRIFTNFYTW